MRLGLRLALAGCVALAGLVAGWFVAPAQADDAVTPATWIQISPVSQRVELVPNDKKDLAFKVTNVGSEKFDFKIYANPYFVTDLTFEPIFETDSSYAQLAKWISFGQTEYKTLEPGQSIEIPYHVTVPADAPGGGQYAVIFAETLNEATAAQGSSIQTISRVGDLVFAQIAGDINRSGELVSLTQPWLFIDQPLQGETVVKNDGNVDFSVHYSYVVSSLFGKELYNNSMDKVVMPGTSRQLAMEWTDGAMFGLFNVTNDISFLGQSHKESQLVFVAPIWALIILAILLIAIIFIIFCLIRRGMRYHRALR